MHGCSSLLGDAAVRVCLSACEQSTVLVHIANLGESKLRHMSHHSPFTLLV